MPWLGPTASALPWHATVHGHQFMHDAAISSIQPGSAPSTLSKLQLSCSLAMGALAGGASGTSRSTHEHPQTMHHWLYLWRCTTSQLNF